MPLRLVVLLCATALVSACSAPANRTTAAPQPAGGQGTELASTEASEADPIVCERVPVTGTRVAKRVCMRRSVREQQRRDSQEMLDQVQRRGVIDTVRRE